MFLEARGPQFEGRWVGGAGEDLDGATELFECLLARSLRHLPLRCDASDCWSWSGSFGQEGEVALAVGRVDLPGLVRISKGE